MMAYVQENSLERAGAGLSECYREESILETNLVHTYV